MPIDVAAAVVAVTGGARGIGLATAQRFRSRGATVHIGDIDPSSEHVLDVRSASAFADFVAAIEQQHGTLDVLVNNAGIMPTGSFLDEDPATTAAVLDVNVGGVINGMRAALPGMIERGRGHVVNVASMLGKTELPGLATYTASKHAVVGLSAAVRAEIEGTGVTITTVLPSIVNTQLIDGIDLGLGRFIRVEPSGVAAAIVDSVRTRQAELPVPRWLGAYPALRPFVPSQLEQLARRAVGHDRALR